MFKSTSMTKDHLIGVLKEILSRPVLDIWHYIQVNIYQDYSKPKIQLDISGNFKTIEEIMEEHWANNKY